MNILKEIINNQALTTAVIAWFIAQLIKVILTLLTSKKIDFTRFVGSGGMPSSHSSFIMALTVSVGFLKGFQSPEFAICACLALVVMYDAAGVRRSAGEQAKILNRIIAEWGHENIKDTGKKLKELLGHSPLEVIAGAVLGTLVGIIRYI